MVEAAGSSSGGSSRCQNVKSQWCCHPLGQAQCQRPCFGYATTHCSTDTDSKEPSDLTLIRLQATIAQLHVVQSWNLGAQVSHSLIHCNKVAVDYHLAAGMHAILCPPCSHLPHPPAVWVSCHWLEPHLDLGLPIRLPIGLLLLLLLLLFLLLFFHRGDRQLP